MEKYGSRLKAARKARGLTQTELAERLGITQKSYQRMETGQHDLKMSTIFQLCKAIGVSADWLMGLDSETVKVEVTEGTGNVKVKGDFIEIKLPKE